MEDRRGSGPAGGGAGLLGLVFSLLRGRRGGGSILVTLLVVFGLYLLGVDPRLLLNGGAPPGGGGPTAPASSTQQAQLADFVSVVLADTEDTWRELFRAQGKTYREPVLVLFSDRVQSACGMAQAATGPFYCPADHKVYIDLDFYRDLKHRLGAPGDFAQAYVIAHEVGHHVQTLLGISARVQARRQRVDSVQANRLSVRLELQADCFAGVWGFHADRSRQLLEAGDIEEAMRAAASIGDDRLQRQARGSVAPWRQRALPMEVRPSAYVGSGAGSSRATSTPAIPSPPIRFRRAPPSSGGESPR